MLDRPEKTDELLNAMMDSLPFEVALMPEVITQLARQPNPVAVKSTETVSNISYAGDEGGIMCHINLADGDNMIVVSLTQVRVPRTLPFAPTALAYQKHRVKKLRKQGSAYRDAED